MIVEGRSKATQRLGKPVRAAAKKCGVDPRENVLVF
jgi:transcriptional/translational regulatory protein YebC/TACO1